MERRNSKDDSPHRTPPNPNVFDDEYALDPDEEDFMPAVSDGFRPSNARERPDGDGQDHDRNPPQRPPFTTTRSAETDLRRTATRNSIAKVPFGPESNAHNGRNPGTHSRGLSSQATPLQHRESVSSTASFATMTRSESVFETGPSHPYGMYPQNTMARSSSIATTSTQQQPQPPSSLQGPTHPYGMYPQNVIDDEPPMPPVQTAIPVGFPGINTGYHRQIGPDGEEQDIIGPDGHMEQLPPYSRYPEEGPTKAALAAEASATPAEPVPNPMASSNDALLANVAPPSPISPPLSPLASVAPARLPQRRPETQTGNVADPRPATTSEAASLLLNDPEFSEKAESVRSVKRKGWRTKRLWGNRIPVIVVVIIIVLLLIFGIVLGAAIGTFLGKSKDKDKDSKDKPKHDDPAPQVSGNSLFDATPISTPASLPPLPTGAFSLPLGIPQESSPGCLTQGNQYSAWSCKMSFAPLMLTINASSNNQPPMATLEAIIAPDGTIQYGLQPPSVIIEPLQLVLDLDLKGYGPAYHFSTRYDKMVILMQEEFAAGSSLRKRQDDKPFRHRFQVQPGDTPWICFWNQTYIEGYIYVKDNSTAASMTGFPPGPTDPFAPVASSSTVSGITAAPTTPSAVSSPTPAPSNVQRRVQRRDDGSFPRVPPYPRIVKIEERRVPGSPQPFCQKMQLLDDGRLSQASSGNGGPILVWLQEQDPTFEEFFAGDNPPSSSASASPTSASQRKRRELDKRTDPSDACHCQWMFQ
ncbi:hypothetical protein BU26DRAFT_92441 [Trematosphaeria pertusa]|uniref:DUF7820 domain-containing protein n=1 Tax=Trematosphaeria pertusa TaxID=390896 RepID=A0A6A6I235_9PLEO|nr:uncharacterized protein BU26DRAFT_92441 [Trematosphaeria pertusa]KAF2244048.1 hypothetical protein BU26DRAFT_92441 [Trematosphaeria pertusa]